MRAGYNQTLELRRHRYRAAMTLYRKGLAPYRLALIMLISLAICHAEPNSVKLPSVRHAPNLETGARPSDWRNSLQSEFKYVPTTKVASDVRPQSIPNALEDPDILVLPTFQVLDQTPHFRRLEKAIKSEEISARENKKVEAISRKLGIAQHVYRGRHWGVGYVSVFYIPVFAGFGASW